MTYDFTDKILSNLPSMKTIEKLQTDELRFRGK